MYEEDQAPFLNAVAKFETEESPEKVLKVLQSMEVKLKKNPPHKYGPRTIDLDLLLYGKEHIDQEGIEVPHPRMHERRFVLEPLCELIDPQKKHPQYGETWIELLTKNCDQECEKTAIPL